MPVRARSRDSSSSRKASPCVAIDRSSSSNASWPLAITPPSRSSTAGSSARARESSVSTAASGHRPPASRSSNAHAARGAESRKAGRARKVARRPVNSRGRTCRKAMRAVMRSTSHSGLSLLRSTAVSWAISASIASCRSAAVRRSREGRVVHNRSSRLPMPVPQVSISDSSVGAASPRSVWISSRLRRVVGGRSIRSLERSTCRLRTCASAWPWVCSA